MLWGESNIGKSFITVDLACSVAAGVPWLDQEVEQGSVVYVANEGVHSFKRRLRAWLLEHSLHEDILQDSLWFTGWPVQLTQGIDRFLSTIRKHKPSLVIFDTMAASAIGYVEDTTEGVGPVIDAALKLRRELATSVLFVHHTGWSKDHERGSSSIRAAMDVSIEMTGEKGWDDPALARRKLRRFLSCSKQRDAEKFSDITVRLTEAVWNTPYGPQKSLAVRRLE